MKDLIINEIVGTSVELSYVGRTNFSKKEYLDDISHGEIIKRGATTKGYCKVQWYDKYGDEVCQSIQKIGYKKIFELTLYGQEEKMMKNIMKEEESHSLSSKTNYNEPRDNNNSNYLFRKVATIEGTKKLSGCPVQGRQHKTAIAKGHFGN